MPERINREKKSKLPWPIKGPQMLFKKFRGGNADSVDLAIPEACYGPELGVKLGQKIV